jgi:hypothetical protein
MCSSKDKGAVSRKKCKNSCIGCKKCERESDNQFIVDGFLAKVNMIIVISLLKKLLKKSIVLENQF